MISPRMKPFHFKYGLRTKDKERSVRKCKRRPTLFILFHKILYNTFIMNLLQNSSSTSILPLTEARKIYEMALLEKETILNSYTFPSTPSSDGFYHIYVKDNTKKGGRKQFKAKSIEALKNKVYSYIKGIPENQAQITFKVVFDMTQENVLANIVSDEKLYSAKNTVKRNQSEYRRYFGSTSFENKPIDEISNKDIVEIVRKNIIEKKLHKKAIDSMRAILRSVFRFAYNNYWIIDNVCLRVDFKQFYNMATPSVPIKKRAYSSSDVEKFLSWIHNFQKRNPSSIPCYALELQILSGMRRGELPPLRWNDIGDRFIEIHQEQITIAAENGTPASYKIVNHTKTHEDRLFPITNDISDLLTRLKYVHDRFYPDSEFLFPANTENGCISNNAVYHFYRKVKNQLGFKQDIGVIIGTHSFRRNAISNTINASNGNIVMTANLYGNSPEVIRKHYFLGIDLDKATQILNQI